MKKIIIFIVSLVFIASISPKFIGQFVEAKHQKIVEDLDKQGVSVKSTSFTRHWFGGVATTIVAVHLNNPRIDDFELTIKEKLFFGPIIFADDGLHFGLSYSQVKLALENDEEANAFLNNKLHLAWLLSLGGNFENYIALDEYRLDRNYKKLVINPAKGKFILTNSEHLYGELNWQGIQLEDKQKIIVDDLSFKIDQQLIRGSYATSDAVTVGDFALELAELTVAEPNNQSVVTLKNVKIKATAKEIADTLSIGLNYYIDTVNVAEQQFEQVNIDLQLDHLDIDTMQAISKFASTINDEKAYSQEMSNKMLTLAGNLIAKEPVLKVKEVSVLTPQGPIVITADAQFDQAKFDQSNVMMTTMMALKLNAQASAPVAFFAEGMKKHMADMYKQQGLIIQEGELFKSAITFAQGQLSVNGKALDN
jgi:uncharacterized protein YdgA (DUF945 family)